MKIKVGLVNKKIKSSSNYCYTLHPLVFIFVIIAILVISSQVWVQQKLKKLVWMGGWGWLDKAKIKLSQCSTNLKLELKLSLVKDSKKVAK